MTINDKLLNPVNRTRLHEEIVGQIQEKIICGDLKCGTKLPPERELAEDLGVNRATVREALKKLEFLRLVDILHGDGIYVRDYLDSDNLDLLKTILYINGNMSGDLIGSIMELRNILVPEMAARATENIETSGLEELKIIIEDEALPIMERDLAVHKYIGRASGNLPYIFILNFFERIFMDYGKLYFSDEENSRKSETFHRDILTALAEKDGQKAKNIMKDVLQYTENQIKMKLQ
jgi:GntR family transcriptional repressor for pyruvate dehydrogenase complex